LDLRLFGALQLCDFWGGIGVYFTISGKGDATLISAAPRLYSKWLNEIAV